VLTVSKLRHRTADSLIFGHHPFAGQIQRGIQYLLSGPREVTFEIKNGPAAGSKFSCLSSHKYFFVREDYECELVKPIQELVRANSIVFDIGAHFGYWAIVLSYLCPDGKVFAFEPSPENRTRLRKNIELNSIKNVYVVPFAASDRSGTSHLSGTDSTASIGDGESAIETITLDEFCRNHPPPEFMLIDVEGHAPEVLRGAAALFANRFIPLICELHSWREQAALMEFLSGRTSRTRKLGKTMSFPNRVLCVGPDL